MLIMICGAMQLHAMRVSGLIGAPCCGRRCLLLFKAVDPVPPFFGSDFGSQKRMRRSGERREGWKEKRESSLGGQT